MFTIDEEGKVGNYIYNTSKCYGPCPFTIQPSSDKAYQNLLSSSQKTVYY